MKREVALERVKALWPEHELTGLPMSALGVIKILEALEVVEFDKEKPAKSNKVVDTEGTAEEDPIVVDPSTEDEPATPRKAAKKTKE